MMRWAFPLLLLLGSCGDSTVTYSSLQLTEAVEDDSLSALQITPYRDSLLVSMGQVLVNSPAPIVRGRPDSPLGSLIADIILEEAKRQLPKGQPQPEFCLLNIGGLRIDLPEGDINVNRVFELMPFDNGITILQLPPASITAMLNYIIKVGGQPVSGIRMEIEDSTTIAVTVNGRPLEDRSYLVATSDYLADGGDKMAFLADNEGRTDLGLKIRDAIIRNFNRAGQDSVPLVAPLDSRIIINP